MYERKKYLDGLRGVMAISVVTCHFICVYYPEMLFHTYAANAGWKSIVARTPLSALINGDFAVQYFFVLSGFLTAFKSI